jgi:TPR repeat protein
MIELGNMLTEDVNLAVDMGMPPSYSRLIEEGLVWYGRAGDTGHVGAMLKAARICYCLGRGTEEESWLNRAADTDDLAAIQRFRDFLIRNERGQEAVPWYHRIAPRLAERGDVSAIRNLAEARAMEGKHEEALALLERLGFQPTVDYTRIGGRLAGEGRIEEARKWYERAAAVGDMYSLRQMGRFEERHGSQTEAERWYRQAIEAGALVSMIELAALVEQQGRTDEAELWLRRCGSYGAEELVAFLERNGRGRDAEIERSRQNSHSPRISNGDHASSSAGPDWPTVVATVTIGTAVLPFIQALVTKAAEDTYEGVRKLLRRVAARNSEEPRSSVDSTLIIVQDPHLRLDIRTDAADEALRALSALEGLAEGEQGDPPMKLTWNPETRTWQSSR